MHRWMDWHLLRKSAAYGGRWWALTQSLPSNPAVAVRQIHSWNCQQTNTRSHFSAALICICFPDN